MIRDERGSRIAGIAEDVTEERRSQEVLAEAQTELAHVSRLTTMGELSLDCPRGQPALGGDDRQGRRRRAGSLPSRPTSRKRAPLDNIAADGKRARESSRESAHSRSARFRAWSCSISTARFSTSSRSRSRSCAATTSLFGPSSTRTLPHVAGDRVQLQQVLLNLIVNASDAMSGVHDRARELTIISRQDYANGVQSEVRDSGTGLDPERAERVFEAFYTTKAEGIGIGLSISRSIVKAHGGRLWASRTSRTGRSSGSRCRLPGEGQS